jgi:CRISPR-associated endoribonuclease Cas6
MRSLKMRFKVKLCLTEPKKEAIISIDYRRRFISLLKRIFGKDFDEASVKPYTFAVYFGKNAKFSNDFITVIDPITFRFSTGNEEVAMVFYNGIIRLKKEGYLHDLSPNSEHGAFFRIEKIALEKEPPLKNKFKALSPVVIERKTDSRSPRERYATPGDPDFNKWLVENLQRRISILLTKPMPFTEFYLEPASIEEVLVKHYGGYVRGFLGVFNLHADNPGILKFVYQYGLGVRTGQGFGYLEVV